MSNWFKEAAEDVWEAGVSTVKWSTEVPSEVYKNYRRDPPLKSPKDPIPPSEGAQGPALSKDDTKILNIEGGTSYKYSTEEVKRLPGSGVPKEHQKRSPFTFRILPPAELSNGTHSWDSVTALKTYNEDIVKQAIDSAAPIPTFNPAEVMLQFIEKVSSGLMRENEPAIVGTHFALDVFYQLKRMQEAPPLTLLINPERLSIVRSKMQQYNDQSRQGYIFQAWGEEQIRLSFSGKTGGWVVGHHQDKNEGLISDLNAVSGYHLASKRDSKAWLQFSNLINLYKNNGCIYNTQENVRSPVYVGMLAIDYDQMTYMGHMETLTYSYDENKPNGALEFEIEFIVSKMYDHAEFDTVNLTRLDSKTRSFSRGASPDLGEPESATRALAKESMWDLD